MKIKNQGNSWLIKKGHRSIDILKSDVKGVHVERRFFRGHTLVVHTQMKPIYFGHLTKGQANKARETLLGIGKATGGGAGKDYKKLY